VRLSSKSEDRRRSQRSDVFEFSNTAAGLHLISAYITAVVVYDHCQ
jgi:hypothetical protein